MKILLLELSCSDSCARLPSRYSGAGPSLRRLAENLDNCYLAAERFCFENDLNDKCIPLTTEQINWIRHGQNLNDYPQLRGFDLYVYCNPSIVLNIEKPQACWAVGQNEKINPQIKHLLLHNLKWQMPKIDGPAPKLYEFVLGIDIPPFQDESKTISVFQCSNHYSAINSHLVANWCSENEIRAVFAGPIDPNYKQTFLNEIDYKWATYIGQIDETEKIKLMKKARCYTNLIAHHINGPQLSLKQAWSYGCSIIASPMGIMPEVIKQGGNGFLVRNKEEFLDAVRTHSWEIEQKDCWNTANLWSLPKMVDSFKNVVEKITNGS